jgi:hypothetical protein
MKTSPLFSALALTSILFMGNAYADDKGMMGHDKGQMMKEHHQTMKEVKGMLKEVMMILKGINHQPSAAEKEKLGKMITRLDEIMKKDDDMAAKWKEMKEKHQGMPGHDMPGHDMKKDKM